MNYAFNILVAAGSLGIVGYAIAVLHGSGSLGDLACSPGSVLSNGMNNFILDHMVTVANVLRGCTILPCDGNPHFRLAKYASGTEIYCIAIGGQTNLECFRFRDKKPTRSSRTTQT